MENSFTSIRITKNAEESIIRMLEKVNSGFKGGQVKRGDLLTWIVQEFEKAYLESSIERVRQDHFDQVAYLESVLEEIKSAKKNGVTDKNISQLLVPLSQC